MSATYRDLTNLIDIPHVKALNITKAVSYTHLTLPTNSYV